MSDGGPIYAGALTFVRAHPIQGQQLRIFGPKSTEHPSVGQPCLACAEPFATGDMTTLLALGPGADEESRERFREGRWFNAPAVELHAACAGLEMIDE